MAAAEEAGGGRESVAERRQSWLWSRVWVRVWGGVEVVRVRKREAVSVALRLGEGIVVL
jgi:hypothetical protein